MDRRAPHPIFRAMSDDKTRSEGAAGGSETAGVPDSENRPGGTAGGARGPAQKPGEIGGPKGPEPTRYGDWEVGGRCTDF